MHCAVETGGFEHEIEVLVGGQPKLRLDGRGGRWSSSLPSRRSCSRMCRPLREPEGSGLARALRGARGGREAGVVPAELVPAAGGDAGAGTPDQSRSASATARTPSARCPTCSSERAVVPALRQAARDVTRALEALAGQTIEKISVTPAPGRHTISINTDRAHLTLSVDRGGVQVDRVEVGG